MEGMKRWRPTPSFVVSCLALFVALSGSAIALQGQNGVKSDDIANGAVHRGDVANNAINGTKVANNSITGTDVNESTLDGSQIPGTSGGGGSGAPSGPAGGDLTGSYPNPTIANGAVGTAALGNGSVTSAKLGTSSVTSAKLGTLTARAVSSSLNGGASTTQAASCQAGEKAVAGGGQTGGFDTFLTDSRPDVTPNTTNPGTWRTGFHNTGTGAATITTWVLCLQT